MPPYKDDPPDQETLREQLIGLGERSLRKSYYPALQQKIEDLKRFRALLDESYDLIFLLQLPSGKIIDINESASRQLGYEKEKLLASSFDVLISKTDLLWPGVHSLPENKKPHRQTFITTFKRCDGSYIPVDVILSQVSFENTYYAVVVARDITERIKAEQELEQANLLLEQRVEERTAALLQLAESLKAEIAERKKVEEQLKFFSLHDFLTGLYNRAYFAEEVRRLNTGRHYPVSLIMCDLDGLKMINDSLGHDTGDKLLVEAANVLRSSVREGDVVARVGGDEFAILISHSDLSDVERVISRIDQLISNYNRTNPNLPLMISLGYATSSGKDKSIDELYREADNNMYKIKILNRQSSTNTIFRAITDICKTKDFAKEGHIDRLWKLSEALAKAVNLPNSNLKLLQQLVEYHDLGKLHISDHILLKPGPLTNAERVTIKAHCESGKRIALAIPELVPIANLIFKHHEYWDGSGYPAGLKGEEIPIECRIFAITDAYEAMTGKRPYRSPLKREEAIAELKGQAGRQFDKELVNRFIEIIERTDIV